MPASLALDRLAHGATLRSRSHTDEACAVVDGAPDEALAHPRDIESYLGVDEAAIHRSGAPV